MKTYIVYLKGEEVGMIKAASHNAAERKAYAKFKDRVENPRLEISVAYTEI